MSESSSRGRYVSSTPLSIATYCLSELSILHQSRYSLLQQEPGDRNKRTRAQELTYEHFSSDKVTKEGEEKGGKSEDSGEQCGEIKQKVMIKLSEIAC